MKSSHWLPSLTALFGGRVNPRASVDELTRSGVAALDLGNALDACADFRKAAELEPQVAMHQVNLAYALQQTGATELALLHLQQAASIEPESFDARYMLGGALERDGELVAAAVHLQHALTLRPDFVQAYADLGRVQAASGDAAAARKTLADALARDADHFPSRLYMGNVCMKLSMPEEARRHYQHALELQPQAAEAHANLGRALHALADYQGALSSLQHSLRLAPDAGRTHAQLAITLDEMGRLEEAVSAAERAVDLIPEDPDAVNFLGVMRSRQGRLDEAVDLYRRSIELLPTAPGAYGNLGLALYDRGDVAGAAVVYRQGLAVGTSAETHDNLGNALVKLGAVDEAIEQYRLALSLKPDNLNTRCNLAGALVEAGCPQQAIDAYRDLLVRDPNHLIAHSNMLFSLSVDARWSALEYLQEARRYDAKLLRHALPAIGIDELLARKRLSVGLVSGDLRSHPVGFFIEGVLQKLYGRGVDLFAYPTVQEEDALTERIRPMFKGWRALSGLDDEAAARAIRDDGIDILIDLAGHSAQNRLPVFAWRPAPLQVSWLGYFASTGVSAIDFVLADPLCVPAGSEWQFSERVWRLPETRLCFTPPPDETTPAVSSLPALRNGFVTFGSFQRLPKLTDEVLALWARVLAAVPTARLRLQGIQTGRPQYVEQTMARLSSAGIEPDRVTIVGPSPRTEYLKSYGEVDLVLDTFPYTGGTTTCEALWMGVPTLALNGETMIARQGVAMLTCAGLPEWVAADADDYVAKARAFAGNIPVLAELRSTLRARLPTTALFDPARFATHLGNSLTEMWRLYLDEAAKRQSASS